MLFTLDVSQSAIGSLLATVNPCGSVTYVVPRSPGTSTVAPWQGVGCSTASTSMYAHTPAIIAVCAALCACPCRGRRHTAAPLAGIAPCPQPHRPGSLVDCSGGRWRLSLGQAWLASCPPPPRGSRVASQLMVQWATLLSASRGTHSVSLACTPQDKDTVGQVTSSAR